MCWEDKVLSYPNLSASSFQVDEELTISLNVESLNVSILLFIVAGGGFEPPQALLSLGYEPRMLPLHHPTY